MADTDLAAGEQDMTVWGANPGDNLGFSAAAHSAVVTKLASRSVTAAVTVMVPNTLGPAELLLHYGTDAQRDHYLPRLASGEEIPCFALTGPESGSDAAATQSEGVVCRGAYEGREVLGKLGLEGRQTGSELPKTLRFDRDRQSDAGASFLHPCLRAKPRGGLSYFLQIA